MLLVAVALLVVLALVQGYLVIDLRGQVTDLRSDTRAAQRSDTSRLGALEKRAKTLEDRVGSAFDSQAVAKAVKPSVFRVEAGNSTGTAFALGKADGTGTNLITNYHVVEGIYATKKTVSLVQGDTRFPATIVKVDKTNDLALLRAEQKFPQLSAATVAVAPGEPVVVVGAPLGLEGSVTTGVISALRTDLPRQSGPTIQFDAAINPGNSGGPVINGRKQVVGVASSKITEVPGAGQVEGIGFAIPVSVVCKSFSVC